VAFYWLRLASGLYGAGLKDISEQANKALDENKSANDAVQAAKRAIDDKVARMNDFCSKDLQSQMSTIINTSRLE
jgi:hypothetical protein